MCFGATKAKLCVCEILSAGTTSRYFELTTDNYFQPWRYLNGVSSASSLWMKEAYVYQLLEKRGVQPSTRPATSRKRAFILYLGKGTQRLPPHKL